MTYILINPVVDRMYAGEELAAFLERHRLCRVFCETDWGAVVREKYRRLAESGGGTVADVRCPEVERRLKRGTAQSECWAACPESMGTAGEREESCRRKRPRECRELSVSLAGLAEDGREMSVSLAGLTKDGPEPSGGLAGLAKDGREPSVSLAGLTKNGSEPSVSLAGLAEDGREPSVSLAGLAEDGPEPSGSLAVPAIEPILLHCAREIAGRPELWGEKKIITTPCQALADAGNELGLSDTEFIPWNRLLERLEPSRGPGDGNHLKAGTLEESPIPPGFFSALGEVDSVTGPDAVERYLGRECWKGVKLVELLYCDGGCHNGDGVTGL